MLLRALLLLSFYLLDSVSGLVADLLKTRLQMVPVDSGEET